MREPEDTLPSGLLRAIEALHSDIRALSHHLKVLSARVSEAELLRTDEAQALLRFAEGRKGAMQLFSWADRWNVPRLHRGRTVLWERRILRDYLERKPWTLRRSG